MNKIQNISVLVGKVLSRVENINDEEIVFETVDGQRFALYHEQDCCESVYVEDVCGDLSDLVGSKILLAEEVTNSDDETLKPVSTSDESYTWTFYKLATVKGYVTIRFYGSSNGYYSESVRFCKRR